MSYDWTFLKQFTHARVAQGRVGNSLPTGALLDFRLAHSRARDSVWSEIDSGALRDQLEFIEVVSECKSKKDFLLRPDLGKKLSSSSIELLKKQNKDPTDCVLILSDGLCAHGISKYAPNFASVFMKGCEKEKVKLGPVILARYARVAIGDEIGALLNTKSVLMLIGERPGLASAESLSIYFTLSPSSQKTDADRNCISNIQEKGLAPENAAEMGVYLLSQALKKQISGIHLKLEYPKNLLLSNPLQ